MKHVTLLAAILLTVAPLAAQGPPPPPNNFIYAQMFRAIAMKTDMLVEQGKVEAAIAEMEKALAVDIRRDEPAYEMKAQLAGRLALTYAQVGRDADAVQTLQKLLAEVPSGSVAEAGALLDAGQVYRQLGMTEEAMKAFDRAIELSAKLARRPRGPAGPDRPPRGDAPPPPRP
jgi:tetratricopeptide (TPR) repeat protein